jgi:large subunit ribosomal protein L5
MVQGFGSARNVENCWKADPAAGLFGGLGGGQSGRRLAEFFGSEEFTLYRLKELYEKEVVPALRKEFGYGSIMAVPRIVKVVLNMGLGEAIYNIKTLDKGVEELTLVAGQKAVVTKAKRSIAGFKLREGMPIGATVTLRRDRMYDFLDKLFNVALPRLRDFRGISEKIFDGRGNCTVGIREQIIFPEIEYDKIEKVRGLNVSIVTSGRSDEEAFFLLKRLGMPFRR